MNDTIILMSSIVIWIVGLILSLWKMELAIALLLFMVPFSFPCDVIGTFTVWTHEGLLAVILCGWIIKAISKRERFYLGNILLSLGLLSVIIASFLSLVTTTNTTTTIKQTVRWIEFGGMYLLALNLINKNNQIKNILLALIISCSLYAFYWTCKSLFASFPLILDPNPNQVAGHIDLILPFVIGILLLSKPQIAKLKYGILILLITLGLFYTGSGSGWLACISAGIIFFCLIKNKPGISIVVISILISLALFRVKDLGGERIFFWQTAINMIKESPLLGLGAGTFYENFCKYAPAETTEHPNQPHNLFLLFGAETGIIGMLAFLWVIVGFFTSWLKVFKRNSLKENYTLKVLLIASLAAFVAFQIHSLFDVFTTNIWLIFGFVLSIPFIIERFLYEVNK